MKLQRNALSVIEAPTGHEDDDELECENMHWNDSDVGELSPPGKFILRLSSRYYLCGLLLWAVSREKNRVVLEGKSYLCLD